MEKDKLLSVKDLAARLNTTENAVRLMRVRGQLPPAIKIGKRVRWRERDIDEWIDRLATEAQTEA